MIHWRKLVKIKEDRIKVLKKSICILEKIMLNQTRTIKRLTKINNELKKIK
jgi:hypothetical protein